MTDPDKIFKGRSSLITGILLKSLIRRQDMAQICRVIFACNVILYNTSAVPVCRLDGIHGVVVHGVEFALPKPVEEIDGKQLE